MSPRRWWERAAARVGRRGASLMFLGLLATVLAANALVPAGPPSVGHATLATLAPLPVWGAAWAVCAAVCWVQAFARQDRIAFALSVGMWWLFGLAYLVAWVGGINPRGWFGGLLWLLFGGWQQLIATWEENPNRRPS